MRAVHEGLGDQNMRVYAEACGVASLVVPSFCGAVDGNLLVAHLAPLLRQLCARMGDAKEIVRTNTIRALFRLMRPPTGNIVSPGAVAMLVLRHLMPKEKHSADSEGHGNESKKANRGAATSWLCRLAALRYMAKEYPKDLVAQPGSSDPGEWIKLKDGLAHCDPTVRHESARLFTLVCKLHVKVLGDEAAQAPAREAWVSALPSDVPAKAIAQVRKLLKLPEARLAGVEIGPDDLPSGEQGAAVAASPVATWEIPRNFATWAGCDIQVLAVLRAPTKADSQWVLAALQQVTKGVAKAPASGGAAAPDEAFACINRAIQQAIGSAGSDRHVFLAAVELCAAAITHLAPILSGLDLTMGLAKTLPLLLERTSMAGTCDVKVGVASDKLIQQLACHPKIGCEATTKMIIGAVARADQPIRPLALLGTLLTDFGMRLCAQRDIVVQLLIAISNQLERIEKNLGDEKGRFTLRPQLIGVLATCHQFATEVFQQALNEVEPEQRKLLVNALREAPNPKLVALGAAAAEQETMQSGMTAAGSMAGTLRRSRSNATVGESPQQGQQHVVDESTPMRRARASGPLQPLGSLAQPELSQDGRSSSMKWSLNEASPGPRGLSKNSSTPNLSRRNSVTPNQAHKNLFSEASTAASTRSQLEAPQTTPAESPRFGDLSAGGSANSSAIRFAEMQKSPMSMARLAANGGRGGDAYWPTAMAEGKEALSMSGKKMHRVSSEGRLVGRIEAASGRTPQRGH